MLTAEQNRILSVCGTPPYAGFNLNDSVCLGFAVLWLHQCCVIKLTCPWEFLLSLCHTFTPFSLPQHHTTTAVDTSPPPRHPLFPLFALPSFLQCASVPLILLALISLRVVVLARQFGRWVGYNGCVSNCTFPSEGKKPREGCRRWRRSEGIQTHIHCMVVMSS